MSSMNNYICKCGDHTDNKSGICDTCSLIDKIEKEHNGEE